MRALARGKRGAYLATGGATSDGIGSLLHSQRLMSSLGTVLVEADLPGLSGELAQRVATARRDARLRGLLAQAVNEQACKMLEDAGIAVLPLKGATLAERLYGDIGARESIDVDLLVAPGNLLAARDLLVTLGWSDVQPVHGWPDLHYRLGHDRLPPIELHWRVHWYERTYSAQALARSTFGADGLRVLSPTDELAFLLLYIARDGFSGLRQTTDVAAWVATNPGLHPAEAINAIATSHPALGPALRTAATHAEALLDLDRGLLYPRFPLGLRQTAALALANPWRTGKRAQQLADIALVDGLLSPRAELPAYVKRQVLRRPRPGHGARLLARHALALPGVARHLRARRLSERPASSANALG